MAELTPDRLAEIRKLDAGSNTRLIRERPNSAIAHRRELLAGYDLLLVDLAATKVKLAAASRAAAAADGACGHTYTGLEWGLRYPGGLVQPYEDPAVMLRLINEHGTIAQPVCRTLGPWKRAHWNGSDLIPPTSMGSGFATDNEAIPDAKQDPTMLAFRLTDTDARFRLWCETCPVHVLAGEWPTAPSSDQAAEAVDNHRQLSHPAIVLPVGPTPRFYWPNGLPLRQGDSIEGDDRLFLAVTHAPCEQPRQAQAPTTWDAP
jgi:hypothetical protein